MNIMEVSDNDVVVLENDKVKENEVVLLDSDDEMNFIITDVISLAGEVKERKNSVTSKESSDRVKPSCSVAKSVGNAENSGSTPGSGSSREPSASIAVKATPSSLTKKVSDNSKEIVDASVSTLVPPAAAADRKPLVEPIPNIEKCLQSWKGIFPWVLFNGDDNTFTCSICKWGYDFTGYCEVYKLLNPNNIFSVAAKLRSHTKRKHHEIAVKEKELIMKLHEGMFFFFKYEILKFSNFSIVQQKMSDLISLSIPENRSVPPLVVKPLVIRTLALAIERVYMESLIQSPFFSVIAFGKIDYMIVRWLTQDYEIVEHLFCSQLQPTNVTMSVLTYLQYKGVNMDRMVSYSNMFSPTVIIDAYKAKVLNVADRVCPVEMCCKWLRSADALQDFFEHIEALPELCQRGLSRFKEHSKGKRIADATESDVSNFILDGEILEFIFNNSVLLDETVLKAPYLENCSKLNFKELNKKLMGPMFCSIYLLRKLSSLFEIGDSPDLVTKLKEIRRLVCGQMKYAEFLDPKEHFVMSIIDMFVCHAIMGKSSLNNAGVKCVDILVRNMSNLDYYAMESVFSTFIPELSGGKGFHQLQQLHSLFGKSKDSSPLKLLANLQGHPKFHLRFPELLKLGQMIMVLPVLNAHHERYTFEVTAAEAYITGRVDKMAVPFLVYILLEGPDDVKCLSTENILKFWHKIEGTNYYG